MRSGGDRLGLVLSEPDDEDERVGTATVATFVRNLAIAGDDDVRNCAEAFADDE